MAAYDMIGQIALFAGAYTPRGWKRCDGSVLNIVEYRALFDIIGDTYGGNGTTTFALPNLGGRYMVCAQGVRPNLRPEAWSEILPPGEDSPVGALGVGFTAGGGEGSIPSTTNLDILDFLFNIIGTSVLGSCTARFSSNQIQLFIEHSTGRYSACDVKVNAVVLEHGTADGETVSLELSDNGALFTDLFATPYGIQYYEDYSDTIILNSTSLTDVTSVNRLKQTPVDYTNAAAPVNTIYYSTTDSKLSYKDPAGVVHNLY